MAAALAKSRGISQLNHNRTAAWGEGVARKALEDRGYRIRHANWHARWGELDLVAEENGVIVMVEVKTRANLRFGLPEESLTAAKKRRLQRTAWAYLEAEGLLDRDWRIDVIAIERAADGSLARLEHLISAVDADPTL